jgi:hypothetical protein
MQDHLVRFLIEIGQPKLNQRKTYLAYRLTFCIETLNLQNKFLAHDMIIQFYGPEKNCQMVKLVYSNLSRTSHFKDQMNVK